MSKILFISRISEAQPGEEVYLKEYKKPFKVVKLADKWVVVEHTVTGRRHRLSPGWPIFKQMPGKAKQLGLV